MKTAEEWLNVVGERVAYDMFVAPANKPAHETEEIIKEIQSDAIAQARYDALTEAAEACYGIGAGICKQAILALRDNKQNL